jgi:putative peptide zinc metalloprotease protein
MGIHPSINEIELFDFSSASKNKMYLASYRTRNFELNENLYQLISILKKIETFDDAAPIYSERRNKTYTSSEIEALFNKFILPLLDSTTTQTGSSFFFTKEILPATLVHSFTKYLKVLFKPLSLAIFLTSSIFLDGLYLINSSNAISYTSFDIVDLMYIGFIFFISVIVHEFGHASASNYFGIKHGHIGIGLYLHMPVFYADVSEAWRLARMQRVVIDLAGIYFQLIFLIPFIILDWISPNTIFQYLIYSINISFLFDLNPFFKFDGYWVFSDLAGIPNLGKRTQETVVYFMRKLLSKKIVNIPFIFSLRFRDRVLMISYVVLVNIFFSYYVIFRAPQFLFGILKELPTSFNSIFYDGTFNFSILSKFLLQLFFLLLSIYFLTRVVIYIFKQSLKIFTN